MRLFANLLKICGEQGKRQIPPTTITIKILGHICIGNYELHIEKNLISFITNERKYSEILEILKVFKTKENIEFNLL